MKYETIIYTNLFDGCLQKSYLLNLKNYHYKCPAASFSPLGARLLATVPSQEGAELALQEASA